MLNSNTSGNSYFVAGIGKGVPAGYTDAHSRTTFQQTTLHCPTREDFIVQVSNMPKPDESSDSDWVDVAIAQNGFAVLPCVTNWMRVKGLSEGDKVYIQSSDARY